MVLKMSDEKIIEVYQSVKILRSQVRSLRTALENRGIKTRSDAEAVNTAINDLILNTKGESS
jgi:hypothetical protein